MTAEVRSVVVKLSMENAQYIAAAVASGDAQVQAQTKAKAATMSSGQALDDLGSKAGKVGAGAALALGLMAKAAVDWESQWAGVSKTVDGTASEMAQLEGELRDLATTLPATHEEIAGVAEAAGQLGVAREDISSFTKTMVMLGETTNLTAEQAATDIAQMANVMGTAPDEIDNVGAALVALGNDGASTEAQILGMAQRIAGAGAQIGLAESDILAIANAAASMGIEVEAGGTAISTVFTEMAKATAQGGEDLDAFAKVAGVSSQEFTRAFEETPAQAFAMFTEGLNRINESGGDVFTTLDGLGMADQRVSRALLSMAASGDLLTDSLALGADAFAENTALSDEFAKRLDTTGAQVRIAFNNIRDAGIDAGAALLPVVSEIADKVSVLAGAFGALPAPAQGAITKLLALTAITGGSLWFGSKVVGGINSTKAALVQLGITSQATGGKLAAAAKSAGLIAVAYTAIDTGINIIDAFGRQSDAADSTSESFDELRKNLEESNLGKYADDFGIDLDRLATEMLQFGDQGTYYAEVIDKMGAANDGLGGKTKQLTDFLGPWIGKTEKASLAAYDLENVLEGMGDAAGSTAVELAALPANMPDDSVWAAFYAGADAAEALGYSSSLSADEAKKQAEALAAVRDAASETASSFFNLSAEIEGTSSTFAGWIQEMADQANALQNFTLNAVEAGEKGVKQGLIDQLRELGPEGAKQMRWLAEATDKEIAAANRAWQRGQDAIDAYSDSITGVPELNVEIQDAEGRRRIMEIQRLVDKFGMTKAEAQAFIRDAATDKVKAIQRLVDQYGITKAEATALLRDLATGDIKSVAAALRALNGDEAVTYITTVRRTRVEGAPGGMGGRPDMDSGSDGATVPKTGLPYADRHIYMLADGEEVISNRHGQADAYRAKMGIPPARRLADGGTTGGNASRNNRRDLDFTVGDSVDELRGALQDLRKDLREAGRDWTGSMQRQASQLVKLTKSYEKQTEKLDRLQDRSDAFAAEVSGSFNNDLFGNGLAGLDLQLEADTNDNAAMERALKKAARRGLDGGLFEALAASGDIGTAQELAGMSRAEIAAYERKFNRRENAAESLGGFAADERFGAAIQRQERFLDKNERAIVRLIQTLEQLPGNIEDGTRKGNGDRDRRIRSSVRAGVR